MPFRIRRDRCCSVTNLRRTGVACGTWRPKRNWTRIGSVETWAASSKNIARLPSGSACRFSKAAAAFRSAGVRAETKKDSREVTKKNRPQGPVFFVRLRQLYFFMSLEVSLASLAASLASMAEPLASLAASVALSAAFMESTAPGAGAGGGLGVTTTGGLGFDGGVTTTGAGLSQAARTATTAAAAKTDLFMVIPLTRVRSAGCFRNRLGACA